VQLSRHKEIAMRRHLRKPGVWIAALILLAVWLLWPRPVSSPPPTTLPPVQTSADGAPQAVPRPAPAASAAAIGTAAIGTDAIATESTDTDIAALPAFLPAEAHDTIRLIRRGGPFEHHQDGGVFGNREGLLPSRPRGYYREYTVETPRLPHRGARRIITGGSPPEVWYYTDDHYDSFRAFQVPASRTSAMERAQ
jgi:ribonuclease T1